MMLSKTAWERRPAPKRQRGVTSAVSIMALLSLCGAACGTADDDADAKSSDGVVPVFFGDGSASVDSHSDAQGGEDTVADGGSDADAANIDGNGGTSGDGTSGDGTSDGTAQDATATTSAVKLEIPEALTIGQDAAMTIFVKDASGQSAPPADDAVLSFEINGVASAVGFDPAAAAASIAAVAVWKTGAGALRLVAIRPGVASVVVRIAGVASVAQAITVAWPTQSGAVARVPDAGGATSAERTTDLAGTVKLAGSTIGEGGLDFSVRFPEDTLAGGVIALGTTATAAASVAFADLAGTKYAAAQGWLWIDQTNKGQYRGTFWGRSAALKPVVAAFIVDRNGKFGVDELDDAATTVATSDATEITTGLHHSRVSVLLGAPGTHRFHLVWREIENVLTGNLRRADVDALTGALDLAKPALIEGINTYDGTPDKPADALGAVVLAWNGGQGLLVWEGRNGKGATKPHVLHAQMVDLELAALTPPFAVSDDTCAGACRPQVFGLSSGRFLVTWTSPQNGVRARRFKAQFVAGALDPAEADPVALAPTGKDGDIAVHGTAMLVSYYDPDQGPVWRPFEDKPSGNIGAKGPAQSYGFNSPTAPAVSTTALSLNAVPPLTFVAEWLDLTPSPSPRTRLIAIDGTGLGAVLDLPNLSLETVQLASGMPSQTVSLGRKADGSFWVNKRYYASYGAPGVALGEAVQVQAATKPIARPSLAYDSESNVWLLAWSGWQSSTGVAFRRFR